MYKVERRSRTPGTYRRELGEAGTPISGDEGPSDTSEMRRSAWGVNKGDALCPMALGVPVPASVFAICMGDWGGWGRVNGECDDDSDERLADTGLGLQACEADDVVDSEVEGARSWRGSGKRPTVTTISAVLILGAGVCETAPAADCIVGQGLTVQRLQRDTIARTIQQAIK
jgi:hypothetical protein